MKSVMNKTRLAEKRFREKTKEDEKKLGYFLKNIKNKTKKLEKVTKIVKSTIINYKKQKRLQNYETKSNMNFKKRRTLIKKQNESNEEIKQNERKQKRERIVDDNELGRFFELPTSNKIYVDSLNPA